MKVKIKTWMKMEEELGLNGWGGINCKYAFTKSMEEQLPENRIIEIEKGCDYAFGKWKEYNISEDMIEEIVGGQKKLKRVKMSKDISVSYSISFECPECGWEDNHIAMKKEIDLIVACPGCYEEYRVKDKIK